ncbi:MAG TPA: hypothetical protein VFF30_06420 [Nitrososphaerales archaeon]|nr:hypothetical protein [Nitrososphaerales archaeon]
MAELIQFALAMQIDQLMDTISHPIIPIERYEPKKFWLDPQFTA